MWKLSHKKGLKCRVTLQGIFKDSYLLNGILNLCIFFKFLFRRYICVYMCIYTYIYPLDK